MIDAHFVADQFLEIYAQLLWPTRYNGDTNVAGPAVQRNIRATIIVYVMSVFRMDGIIRSLDSRDLDESIDVLRSPDPQARANSAPDLGRRQPSHLLRPLPRRELIVEQIREWNRELARIEADERRRYMRRFRFDGYLSSDEDDEDSENKDRRRREHATDDNSGQRQGKPSDKCWDTASDSGLSINPTLLKSLGSQGLPGTDVGRSELQEHDPGEQSATQTEQGTPEDDETAGGEDQTAIQDGMQNLHLTNDSQEDHNASRPEDALSNFDDSDAEAPSFEEDDVLSRRSSQVCPFCGFWHPDLESRVRHVEKPHPE